MTQFWRQHSTATHNIIGDSGKKTILQDIQGISQ